MVWDLSGSDDRTGPDYPPPVGFNLFVISSLNTDDVFLVAKDAFPFFALMALATVLITVFPQIVLFLPNLMR